MLYYETVLNLKLLGMFAEAFPIKTNLAQPGRSLWGSLGLRVWHEAVVKRASAAVGSLGWAFWS